MTRSIGRFALLVFALTLSVSAFAKSKTENITLSQDATLNGTNLPAGEYVVKYDVEGSNAQVKFIQGRKEVATANGQIKTVTKKSGSNLVVVNTEGSSRSISEIQFGGKDTAISFEAAGASAGK